MQFSSSKDEEIRNAKKKIAKKILLYIIKINKKINQKYDNISLNAKSKQIIEAIKREGNLHIDSICDYTGIEIKYVNSIINELVLNELVVEMNNKTYSLNV